MWGIVYCAKPLLTKKRPSNKSAGATVPNKKLLRQLCLDRCCRILLVGPSLGWSLVRVSEDGWLTELEPHLSRNLCPKPKMVHGSQVLKMSSMWNRSQSTIRAPCRVVIPSTSILSKPKNLAHSFAKTLIDTAVFLLVHGSLGAFWRQACYLIPA